MRTYGVCKEAGWPTQGTFSAVSRINYQVVSLAGGQGPQVLPLLFHNSTPSAKCHLKSSYVSKRFVFLHQVYYYW